jgi:hypothetical protein
MTPPRTQTPPFRVLTGGARPTSGVETLEVISPELALVDPELATRARALLRTYDADELVAGVRPTPQVDQTAPAPTGDEQAVLSPELALVDPELAAKARAQLPDVEPASPAAPVRLLQRPVRAEPVEPTLRARSKRNVIVAAVALAAGLGGAAAIWAGYSGGASGSRPIEQASFQPLRELSPVAALSERSQKTTARASKQGIAGQRHVRRAPRPRPAAFHVPGAPKEPLDEIPLPARARHLNAWLTRGRGPTAANQRHWLYQHAWIVTGARFGWWHGAAALDVLIRVDRRVESQWGIGYRSEALARGALAAVRRLQRHE